MERKRVQAKLEEQGVEVAVDADALDVIGHAGERQPAAVEQREGQQRLQRIAGGAQRVGGGTFDERLDERAFIVPGLGDAGDRLFGTA